MSGVKWVVVGAWSLVIGDRREKRGPAIEGPTGRTARAETAVFKNGSKKKQKKGHAGTQARRATARTQWGVFGSFPVRPGLCPGSFFVRGSIGDGTEWSGRGYMRALWQDWKAGSAFPRPYPDEMIRRCQGLGQEKTPAPLSSSQNTASRRKAVGISMYNGGDVNIVRIADRLPFLINDLMRRQRGRRRLSVFLCGKQPRARHHDLRAQLEVLLERRMGCEAFLGEDIEDIHVKARSTNVLSIEVSEAITADIILVFLESPGAIAELTAFSLDERIKDKLVVFNDKKHKQEDSFLNRGPLSLLKRDQVVYYDPEDSGDFFTIVRHVDIAVAKAWYHKITRTELLARLELEHFTALALLYALYPVRYGELLATFPWDEKTLNRALSQMFDESLAAKREDRYVPLRPLERIGIGGQWVVDIARVRLRFLNSRLLNEDCVSDYRLIV